MHTRSKRLPFEDIKGPYAPSIIRKDFADNAKKLLDKCWDSDPLKRISIHDLNTQFNNFIIESFIHDDLGKQFWRENFPNKVNKKYKTQVK